MRTQRELLGPLKEVGDAKRVIMVAKRGIGYTKGVITTVQRAIGDTKGVIVTAKRGIAVMFSLLRMAAILYIGSK